MRHLWEFQVGEHPCSRSLRWAFQRSCRSSSPKKGRRWAQALQYAATHPPEDFLAGPGLLRSWEEEDLELVFFYTIEVGGRLTDHRKLTCTRDAPQLLLTVRTTGGWNATGDHNRGPQLGTTAGWNATPDHKIACDFGCGSEF